MRLRRLDLTRYGRFTDRSIAFGERHDGIPDLHVIYGPNEAGKSTTLAAFLDLLFGIETKSPFNFLHPYAAMQIGATIEFASGTRDFVRLKRDPGSLLDGHARPVAESLIQSELGGIDRSTYRAMFSLDEETLEQGSTSILESKGDLGQLLFSASAGLGELSRELEELRNRANEFYKFHARKYALADFKERLRKLKDERQAVDTAAPRYAVLREHLREARGRYDGALLGRTKTATRVEEIKGLLAVLPRWAELKRLRDALSPLADLPTPPEEWHDLLPGLRKAELTYAVKSAQLTDAKVRLSAEIKEIVVDERCLRLAARVETMADLVARHRTAGKDIPERLIEVSDEDHALAGILARLGRKDEAAPERLLLDAVTSGRLRMLIERRSGVETACRTAERDLVDARQRLADTQRSLEEAGGRPLSEAARADLAAALAVFEANNFAARLSDAARACRKYHDQLAKCAAALLPWNGGIAELGRTSAPQADAIAAWKEEVSEARSEHKRCKQELDRIEDEISHVNAERGAMTAGVGVVSDEEAARVRADREATWAEHRRRLDTASADTFEAALRRDDIVTTARILREADVQKLREVTRRGVLLSVEVGRAKAALERARDVLQEKEGKIAEAIALVLPTEVSLPVFEVWLAKRMETLAIEASREEAERVLTGIQENEADACQNLLRILKTAGIAYEGETDPATLQSVTREMLGRDAKLAGMRTAVQEREGEVKLRERSLATARADEALWDKAWRDVCSQCWLADVEAIPVQVVAQEILPVLADLRRVVDKRASLLDRIQKMQRDQSLFDKAVCDIAGELGLARPEAAPLETWQVVVYHLADARTAETARRGKLRELVGLEKQSEKLANAQELDTKLKERMLAFFDVPTLEEVAEKLTATKDKARLRKALEEASQEITDTLTQPLAEAEIRLAEADREALAAERNILQARSEGEDQRLRELFAELRSAEAALEQVGSDDRTARLEEQRQTTLLGIEEGARHYLKLRIGVAAAEHALSAYRHKHRSAMMAEASDAFCAICRGAYDRLESQPQKGGEALIAVAADGSSKVVDALSRGTRFQLYFALRVAAYHEFTGAGRASLPFIADDIMESFDDHRAEEALRLLARMAENGQVIHLTHHPHLCAIARKVCPQAVVHDLSNDAQTISLLG